MVETQSVKVAEMWSGFAVSDCTGKKNNEKSQGFDFLEQFMAGESGCFCNALKYCFSTVL